MRISDWSSDVCSSDLHTDPIKIAVDIEITDKEARLDFSRSSDQVAAAINSYINYTRAYSFFAIKILTGSTLPQNVGSTRPVQVTSRPGSFMNAVFPAPSGGRAAIERKSVVSGKSVSVRLDLGGRRISK